jgi:hypothetical protein
MNHFVRHHRQSIQFGYSCFDRIMPRFWSRTFPTIGYPTHGGPNLIAFTLPSIKRFRSW